MKWLACPFLAGTLFAVLLIVVVFATGQTFGQRCAVKYEKPGIEWYACVVRLSKGWGI